MLPERYTPPMRELYLPSSLSFYVVVRRNRTHSSFGKRLLFPETRIWLVGGAADVDVIMVQLDGKASGWTDAGVIH